ncbi:NUDIX domain-containing protein [Nocardia brasiliensis]|uniref:NUDIX hydrolase n=1 Tax=Nocardia brasiliensis TaxID=37326 RepID=UPI00366ABBA6
MDIPSTDSDAVSPVRHKTPSDVHLLLRRGESVLFGQRQNTGFEDGAWHVPSGHVEAGESVVGALVREAEEEIGVVIAPENVRFSHIMHNSSGGGRVAFFFTVTRWAGEPVNRELGKCTELQWFESDALPDRMVDYCRVAIRQIADGSMFSTYGW